MFARRDTCDSKMVRNYQRKSFRASWTTQDMEKALNYLKNQISIRDAANELGIPRETLRRRLEESKKGVLMQPKLGRFVPVFPIELEKELSKHIISMQNRFFGLNTNDVRQLAYELAEKNNLPHSFCKDTKLAGVDWLKGFRRRHPEISLRSPEKTSIARARCFNKPTVEKFFGMMEQIYFEGNFPPHRIFNVDETAITTVRFPILYHIALEFIPFIFYDQVQTRSSKIFSSKAKRQVGTLSSAERGILITGVICMSATGVYVPPMLIFPRIRMKDELKCGAPAGTLFRVYPQWMDADGFIC